MVLGKPKVEPLTGEPFRMVDSLYGPTDSGYFFGINRSKRAIAVDLKSVDGRSVLDRLLADADVLEPPILDWFHIALRLQHLKQIGDGLAAGDPARAAAKAVIVTEVERLHWRIWNGKAKDARKSIERIRALIHHFRGERDSSERVNDFDTPGFGI